MTVLLREAIGDRLRHARTNQHRSLREISHSARVSLGYLSEVERGQKEASSELLAAICEALRLPLPELLHTVASDVAALDSMSLPGAELGRAELDRAQFETEVARRPAAASGTHRRDALSSTTPTVPSSLGDPSSFGEPSSFGGPGAASMLTV